MTHLLSQLSNVQAKKNYKIDSFLDRATLFEKALLTVAYFKDHPSRLLAVIKKTKNPSSILALMDPEREFKQDFTYWEIMLDMYLELKSDIKKESKNYFKQKRNGV